MFEITRDESGAIVVAGRFDAAQAERAEALFDTVGESRIVDIGRLEYISSAGLGILLKTQKRLMRSGAGLKFINVNHHIHDVFRYSGFDHVFEIEGPKTK